LILKESITGRKKIKFQDRIYVSCSPDTENNFSISLQKNWKKREKWSLLYSKIIQKAKRNAYVEKRKHTGA